MSYGTFFKGLIKEDLERLDRHAPNSQVVHALDAKKRELDDVYANSELADRLVDTLTNAQYYVTQGAKDAMINECLSIIRAYRDGGDGE